VLTVENVRFYSSDDIEITIRNSGTSDAEVVEVYQGTASTSLEKQSSVDYDPDTQISAGSSIVIDFDMGPKSGHRRRI